MDVRRIIADIDAEIAKLQGVKATLSGLSTPQQRFRYLQKLAVVAVPREARMPPRRGTCKGSKAPSQQKQSAN